MDEHPWCQSFASRMSRQPGRAARRYHYDNSCSRADTRTNITPTCPLRIGYLFYKIVLMTPSPSIGRLELAALLAVARLGDDAYGLAIRRDLSDRTGRDYSVGAVYTTLQRLQDKGLLKSRTTDPLPVRGGRSRRQFIITGAGSRAIREAERNAAALWAGVGTIRPEPA